jgi:hypothetical protein
MADEAHLATGVGAAMLIDTLLGLGIEDPLALTNDERVRAIEQAASEGRIKAELLATLRDLGALSLHEA